MNIRGHTLAAGVFAWMLAIIAVCTALGMLGGCTTLPKEKPITAPKVVQTPISKACVPADLPAAPATYPDDALTASSPADERFRLNAAANQARKARLAIVEPVIQTCR